MLGQQALALPDEGGFGAVDVLGHAPSEGIVAVAGLAAVGQLDAGQAVLAVVLVIGDQLLAVAAAFAGLVAEAVVGGL